MKTMVLSRSCLVNILKQSIILCLGIFWIWNQTIYAGGAPATPSKSASNVRTMANVHFEAGQKLQDAGNYQQASKKYASAVQTDPAYAEAWSNLGYTYRKLGNFNKAVKAYKKAIRLAPNLAEAHEYLGEAYAEQGMFALAEKELASLRELGSDEADELEEFISKMKSERS